LGLLVGTLLLVLLWLLTVVLEPYVIALAVGAAAEPQAARSSASGWANSNVWVLSVASVCVALVVVGFCSKRLSAPRSWVAPAVMLAFVLGYVFFAQFPATRSVLRVGGWAAGLPVSLAFGAWLASRGRGAV
jgi:hypothetical protein